MLVAIAAPTSGAFAAVRPPQPPPKPGPMGGPPPAWIEAGGLSTWLAYGSYCWLANGHGGCVDFIPAAQRPDVPRLALAPGELLIVHLSFSPTSRVELLDSDGLTLRRLARAKVVRWRASRFGILLISAKSAYGEAEYVVRLGRG
jgi:hypothetical protein